MHGTLEGNQDKDLMSPSGQKIYFTLKCKFIPGPSTIFNKVLCLNSRARPWNLLALHDLHLTQMPSFDRLCTQQINLATQDKEKGSVTKTDCNIEPTRSFCNLQQRTEDCASFFLFSMAITINCHINILGESKIRITQNGAQYLQKQL